MPGMPNVHDHDVGPAAERHLDRARPIAGPRPTIRMCGRRRESVKSQSFAHDLVVVDDQAR